MIMSDIHDPLVTAKPTSKAHSLQHKKGSEAPSCADSFFRIPELLLLGILKFLEAHTQLG